MQFTLTCPQCKNIMELEGTIHVEKFQCNKCGADIDLRIGRMEEGVLINGQYKTLYKINDDGYSTFYIALDKKKEKLRCLRVFDKTLTKSIEDPTKFAELIEAVSSLAGTQHLAIIDSGIFNNYIYTVSSFRKVETLDQVVDAGYIWDGKQAIDLIYEILESLDEASINTGSGHFNLTPNNIFISDKGTVHYHGYGIGPQLLQDKLFLKSDSQVFDIFYLSPELAQGTHFPNQASDIYSLGMVFYYMITGLTPYANQIQSGNIPYGELQVPHRIKNSNDPQIMTIFAKMIASDSKDRYQSYAQALQAIDSFYQASGQQRIQQMDGCKSPVYKTEEFQEKVQLYVKDHHSKNTAIRQRAVSSNTIRKKMATQFDIDIQTDFTKKIKNPNRVKRVRKLPQTNATPLNRAKRLRRQQTQKKANLAPIFIILTLVVVAISISILSTKKELAKQKQPVAKTLSKAVEIKAIEAAPTSAPVPQPKKVLVPNNIDLNWYRKELSKAEIDFPLIDNQLVKDAEHASSRQRTTLQAIEREIKAKKADAQRRLLIELKSEAGTLIFRKKYSDAIALYELYDGPFKEETADARQDLIDEIKENMQTYAGNDTVKALTKNKIKQIELNKAIETMCNALIDNSLAIAIEQMNIILALDDSPSNRDFAALIPNLSRDLLVQTTLNNIARDPQATLSVKQGGKVISGKVKQVDVDNEEVQLELTFLNSKLLQKFHYNDLDINELVQWTRSDKKNYSALLKFYSYLLNGNLLTAKDILAKYQGPFAEQLRKSLYSKLDIIARDKLTTLLESFHIKLGDEITQQDLAPRDALALYVILEKLFNNYTETEFIRAEKARLQALLRNLQKLSPSISKDTIFIGPNHQNLFPKLNYALQGDHTQIRLLPGVYEDTIILNKKRIQIIGCTGVTISQDISINTSHIELRGLDLIGEVNIIVHAKADNVKIIDLKLKNGLILVPGKTNNLSISNSIFSGIQGSSDSKVKIDHCTIINTSKKNSASISGNINADVENSILKNNYNIFKDSIKNIEFKNCIFYSKVALYQLRDTPYYDLKALERFSDFSRCYIRKPQFQDEGEGDLRPQLGSIAYNNKIGIKMDEHLKLRSDLLQ